MIAEEEMLAVRAAELYYDENKTQDEIGSLLNLTRWKVGRLLSEARERGIVRIEIVHPRARRLTLERELRATLGLRDAVVVPSSDDTEELQSRVALAAADYLTGLRPVPRLLGVSWGRTLHDIAGHLKAGWATNVNVVQINGGVSLNKRSSNASNTAVTIATKGGGSATLLPSPAILEREEIKLAIESDRTVRGVLDLGASAAAYIYSAGLVTNSSVLVESGYLSTKDVSALVSKGAIGDVVGRYIDADGNIVDHELDRRTVGISHDALRAAPLAIAVIAGEQKHDICRTVVRSGLCSVLITDELNARYVLENAS